MRMASVLCEMRGQAVFIKTTTATCLFDIEADFFSTVQQVSVGQAVPTALPGLFNDMAEKPEAQLPGCPVIKRVS